MLMLGGRVLGGDGLLGLAADLVVGLAVAGVDGEVVVGGCGGEAVVEGGERGVRGLGGVEHAAVRQPQAGLGPQRCQPGGRVGTGTPSMSAAFFLDDTSRS